MKILYMTDTHIRGTSPRSRTDDFQQAIREKIEEVIDIAERERVDLVLHGGDLFDRPNLSPAIVREFAGLFRRFPAPIFAVAGNHDIYGHNPATVERTMLGLLDAFGAIRLVNEGERIKWEKDDITVQISAQPFHYDLDKRKRHLDYTVPNECGAEYCVHMVHGMLVDRALPDSIPHTAVHEVWSDSVDVLLTGHYHAGFPVQHRNGKYIVNPGALARINNHRSEIKRMPQVALLELNKEGIDVRLVPLQCAKRGEEILDRSYIEKEEFREKQLGEFIREVKSVTDFQSINIMDILFEMSKLHDIGDVVTLEAQRRIAIEQEAERESSH